MPNQALVVHSAKAQTNGHITFESDTLYLLHTHIQRCGHTKQWLCEESPLDSIQCAFPV